ncbi:MAG: signal peptidase I [Planctomycetota bacterium]|nr:signal peptidase I [Planctomycetota bacterium]
MWLIEKYIKYGVIFVVLWALLFLQLNYGCSKVKSMQMQPLMDNEKYFVYKKSSDMDDLKTGSIIYYERAYRGLKEIDMVGRVVAREGERIRIESGNVILDGTALAEAYVNEDNRFSESFEEIQVPKGHVYVMNDNRRLPTMPDSRRFGPLWAKSIIGIIKE